MTLQEAIAEMQKPETVRHWFRPVSWRGLGQAFDLSIGGKRVEFVPTPRGGSDYMTTAVSDLIGDWELVEVETVLDERGGK